MPTARAPSSAVVRVLAAAVVAIAAALLTLAAIRGMFSVDFMWNCMQRGQGAPSGPPPPPEPRRAERGPPTPAPK